MTLPAAHARRHRPADVQRARQTPPPTVVPIFGDQMRFVAWPGAEGKWRGRDDGEPAGDLTAADTGEQAMHLDIDGRHKRMWPAAVRRSIHTPAAANSPTWNYVTVAAPAPGIPDTDARVALHVGR